MPERYPSRYGPHLASARPVRRSFLRTHGCFVEANACRRGAPAWYGMPIALRVVALIEFPHASGVDNIGSIDCPDREAMRMTPPENVPLPLPSRMRAVVTVVGALVLLGAFTYGLSNLSGEQLPSTIVPGFSGVAMRASPKSSVLMCVPHLSNDKVARIVTLPVTLNNNTGTNEPEISLTLNLPTSLRRSALSKIITEQTKGERQSGQLTHT